METLVAIVMLVLFSASFLFFVGYLPERHRWNGGMCRTCQTHWQYFDRDSQGGYGFKCENGHVCWISYPGVIRGQHDA